jgi:hypothetical protein
MNDVNPKAANTTAISRQRFGALLFVALLFFVPVMAGRPQQTGSAGRPPVLTGQGGTSGQHQTLDYANETPGAFDALMAERRLKMMNNERRKSLVSDSDKLFKLATQLNNEIANSNTGSLTPEQLRKVAEIEKLAHNVRDKMTQALSNPKVTYFPINESQ